MPAALEFANLPADEAGDGDSGSPTASSLVGGNPDAPVTVEGFSATYIHASRIDESGLRALARLARERTHRLAGGWDSRALPPGAPGVPPNPALPSGLSATDEAPGSRRTA